MRTERLALGGGMPGTRREIFVLRFGNPGARPLAYLQAALHADEPPGLLVMYHLRRLLEDLEARGEMLGEVIVVPAANPIGLDQRLLGSAVGRFALDSGQNFNRGFPALGEALLARLGGQLRGDPEANRERIRRAMLEELAARQAVSEAEALKLQLMRLACPADIALDLHCDHEAVLHLYTHVMLELEAEPLARLLGAQVVLLAELSGDDPFDEALSRPWFELKRHHGSETIAGGCFSATVELRGEAEVDHDLALRDAQALCDFLRWRRVLAGTAPRLPEPLCRGTPLAGSEPIVAPVGGVVAYHRAPGAQVSAGDAIADVVDPLSGDLHTVRAGVSGILYARSARRLARPGDRLAKIAGTAAFRTGPLLSP